MIKLPDGTEIQIMNVNDAFENAIRNDPRTRDIPLARGECECGCGVNGYVYPPLNMMFIGFDIAMRMLVDQGLAVATVTAEMREMEAAGNGTKH